MKKCQDLYIKNKVFNFLSSLNTEHHFGGFHRFPFKLLNTTLTHFVNSPLKTCYFEKFIVLKGDYVDRERECEGAGRNGKSFATILDYTFSLKIPLLRKLFQINESLKTLRFELRRNVGRYTYLLYLLII